MARMSEDDLLAHLQAHEDDAAQYSEALGIYRTESQREYFRDPYPGDEELEGWSRIVTSEVQDTVEWMLPELLDVFTSTDRAVEFEPSKAEDVQGAQQATDTCNHVFYKQNNGFLVLYTAFKDALISQNCAVMWRKEKEQVRDTQELRGAPAEVIALAEQEGYEVEAAAQVMGAEVPLFDVRLAKTSDRHTIKVEAFPPEQLHIKRDWTSPVLADCPYVCRILPVTLSDLKEMGFDDVTAADLRASDGRKSEQEEVYRNRFDTETPVDTEDESQAQGYLRVEYVLVDYDGDGIAERRLIYRLESRVLSNEETSHVQIATTSPVITPHRWNGQSVAEMVSDIQRLKTDLTRALVNGANLAVNPRKTVLTDMNGAPFVDVDDLLDFRVGGIVKQTRPDALGIEPQPFNGSQALPVLEYIDAMAEKRTGVSKQQQGLDPNALRPDRTAQEVMMTANAAKQRIKLIARIFAETLLKPVFLGILKLLTDGEMQPLAFRLRGQFVKYDPNEWRDQYDMTINVGLGTGDKAQQIGFYHQLLGMQMQLAQSPFGQLMIQPQNIYESISKIVELMGQKNINDFIGNPNGQPLPKSGPPPQVQIEQAKLQQQGQLKQMELQHKAQSDEMQRRQQAELELVRQRAQQETDANRQRMEAQMHQMKLQQEAELSGIRAQYEDQRHVREMQFQRWKAELDAAVKVKAADIASATNKQDAATQAATDEVGREVRP